MSYFYLDVKRQFLNKLDIGGTVGPLIEPKIDVFKPVVDWDDDGWTVEVP